MLFKSQVYTQASGSVGGLVYSHNAGGMYTRARAVPTDPGSFPQLIMRAIVTLLTTRWIETLTQDQRDAWDVYAANVPLVGPLGDPRYVSGLNHYLRANTVRQQAGFAAVDDGPTVYDTGGFTAPTIDHVYDNRELSLNFTNTDDWANEVGGAMVVWGSRPQNPTINYFKGPYLFADSIDGAAIPPTSPATMTYPFALTAGQQVFLRARTFRADGRLAADHLFGGAVSAAP